jgi:hypothetical protein
MIRRFQLANLIGDIPQLLPVRQPYHRTDRQVGWLRAFERAAESSMRSGFKAR